MSKVDQLRMLREQRAYRTLAPSKDATSVQVSVATPQEESAPPQASAAEEAETVGLVSAQVADPQESHASVSMTTAPKSSNRRVLRGMHECSDAELRETVSQIVASGVSDPDEVLAAVMEEFGFQRRGKIIKKRVFEALALLPVT